MIFNPDKSAVIKTIFSALLILCAVTLIITPNHIYFKWAANYIIPVMFGYLGLGLLLFMTPFKKLMFVSFGCCAAICLFLYDSVEDPFMEWRGVSNDEAISIAHFNASKARDHRAEAIDLIINSNADVVSIQEICEDWAEELRDCMQDDYPYLVALPDTGFYGMAILSKYPLTAFDTFHLNGKPSLITKVEVYEKSLNLLSTHTTPALDNESYDQLVSQLDLLSAKIEEYKEPFITVGEYNAVSWSNEIKAFRKNANLKISDKGISPTFPAGSMNIMDAQVDHIFYSSHFKCRDFKRLDGQSAARLGIMGSYEFQPLYKTLNGRRKG